MSLQAKVLYDFVPQQENDLGIVAGEIVTITVPDCGDGWSKARNDSGLMGMVPTSYVEMLHIPEPSIPPPPIPDVYVDMSVPVQHKPPPVMGSKPRTSYMSNVINQHDNDDPDDSDWDDSDEESVPQLRQTSPNSTKSVQRASTVTSTYGEAKFGNIRMPKPFLRSGGEEFLLGTIKPDGITTEAKVLVTQEDGSEICVWEQTSSPKTGEIESYKKQTKFRGIKSFISYTIKSSYLQNPIEHRYKQFDWLHKQLVEKYPCVVIPPLPSPKVVGRYEDDFIAIRRRGLQRWLTHVLSHPVLSEGGLIHHFLSTTDPTKWKSGKRKLEADTFKGAKFFFNVDAPDFEINWANQSKRMERASTFQDSFEKSSKGLSETIIAFNKRQSGPIQKEFGRLGSSFCSLSRSISFSPDNNKSDHALVHAIQKTGESYEKIAKLFADEGQKDSEMEENLDEIIGIIKEVPSLIELTKCSISTVENGYRRSSETKVTFDIVENLDRNVRVVSRSIDAELIWLQKQRQDHLRKSMRQYLENQVELFSKITSILTETLSQF